MATPNDLSIEPEAVALAGRHRLVRRAGWWTLLVGLAHAVPAVAESMQTAHDLAQASAWEYRNWSVLTREVFTPSMVACLWPLCVALALIVTGLAELIPAALLAALWLMIDDICRVLLLMSGRLEYDLSSPLTPQMSWLVDLGYHVLMVCAGLGLVFLQVRLMRQARQGSRKREISSRPAAIYGRLAILGSLLFALFVFGSQLWIVYERFGLRIDALRTLMARDPDDAARSGRRRRPLDARIEAAYSQFQEAARQSNAGDYTKAQRSYARSIETLEGMAEQRNDANFMAAERAQALNNLAWLLATCPDVAQRDPAHAVKFSQRSIELAPGQGTYWNTLGAALFRDGQYLDAVRAFEKSMSLRNGGDAHDWFFLAMTYFKMHQPHEAESWFDRAVDYRERSSTRDRELYRFHLEAAQLLGRPEPAPLPRTQSMDERTRTTVLPGGRASTPIE